MSKLVRLSRETYEELYGLLVRLQYERRRRMTFDEVVRILLESYRRREAGSEG